MNIKLQKKLFKQFPLTFTQRYLDCSQTCMCWGIDCPDSWFDILYKLCEVIEKENKYRKLKYLCKCSFLQYLYRDIIEENYNKLKLIIYIILFQPGPYYYLNIYKLFSFMYIHLKFIHKIIFPLYHYIFNHNRNIILKWLYNWCVNYGITNIHYIQAVQVKEKYGTLRFYLNDHSNLIIEKEIDKAYTATKHICSECGKYDKWYIKNYLPKKYWRRKGTEIKATNGWIQYVCSKCNNKLQHSYTIATHPIKNKYNYSRIISNIIDVFFFLSFLGIVIKCYPLGIILFLITCLLMIIYFNYF